MSSIPAMLGRGTAPVLDVRQRVKVVKIREGRFTGAEYRFCGSIAFLERV